MSELKTLEDFEKNIGDCVAGDEYDRDATNWIREDKLKAEAIKWVKMEEREQYPLKSLWRVFFNITEEDLA